VTGKELIQAILYKLLCTMGCW